MVLNNFRTTSTITIEDNVSNVKYPRYIGDLRSGHFISPGRANRNLKFIKNKYNEILKNLKLTKIKTENFKTKLNLMKVL